MRLTLPSPILHILFAGVTACSHPSPPPPPGPPIPAEPDVQVGTADEECKAFEAALETYGKCPNLDEDDRTWIKNLLEYADQSFAAGKKAEIPANAQGAMAHACRRAATSVQFANERCHNGPKPKPDW